MKEKAIVSSFTLIASLSGYYYAKSAKKDTLPYLMVSGFIGALIGEVIVHTVCKKKDDKNNFNKIQKP